MLWLIEMELHPWVDLGTLNVHSGFEDNHIFNPFVMSSYNSHERHREVVCVCVCVYRSGWPFVSSNKGRMSPTVTSSSEYVTEGGFHITFWSAVCFVQLNVMWSRTILQTQLIQHWPGLFTGPSADPVPLRGSPPPGSVSEWRECTAGAY